MIKRESKIDKRIILGIFDRALVRDPDSEVIFKDSEFHKKEIFRGPAKKWEKFWREDFQEFFAEHNILPKTRIAIADLWRGKFVIIKV